MQLIKEVLTEKFDSLSDFREQFDLKTYGYSFRLNGKHFNLHQVRGTKNPELFAICDNWKNWKNNKPIKYVHLEYIENE